MECTDRHERYFLRQLTQRTVLYTEMVTARAVIHGDRDRLLEFDATEHPIALQLGGSEAAEMARCAAIGSDWGYDEINMNVGCPSDRVQSGRFGACLMLEPARVADCVSAMTAASSVPITVKCRTGVDDHDSFEQLCEFIQTVASAGCKVFAVHARKAWLNGLSPKQNREIPPLRYDLVRRLPQLFPTLEFIINGGVTSLDSAYEHLGQFDGVMIGRAAYRDPYLLASADELIFAIGRPVPTRQEAVLAMLPYVEAQLARGVRLASITRHMVGLFLGQPRAKAWRRHISEHAHHAGAGPEVLQDALAKVVPLSLAA